ncbi:MAG: esterase-like activity of phytase family protein [Ferrovibrio sp.]|uniref:esterase-like activity of phytase family protein n=1 Tax=Ferrovibrio sp. TaxID=1917215 RepID=UPI00391BB1A7
MKSTVTSTAILMLGLVWVPATQAQDARQFPATLAGHALLPAASFVPAPGDAPSAVKISGKFTGAGRNDKVGSVEGTSFISDKAAPRKTGISLPFEGQPVQGFSGIKSLGNGEFLVLTDNGFGSKADSSDALLKFHRLKVDWTGGKIERSQTVFLSDPDRKVPFPIALEGSDRRYLTGADFDIESIQQIGDTLWFGDEFGPYLIATDLQGRVKAVHDTKLGGKVVRSPDHHTVRMPAVPGAVVFEARRSRGYEGMAAAKDGKFLYPLMEGPLWDAEAKAWETAGGREYLRVLEFDVQKAEWTGRSWKYRLEVNGNNIGDFNMIDANTGLIIERDNGEGVEAQACNGPARTDCFNVPAKFKRIYKIDLSQVDEGGFVKKVGYIDLMDIADPDKKAKQGHASGKFSFPFVTIEDVDVVDAQHIVVGNDNNLPFSTGRTIGKNDDNELILLRVPEFLAAK